MLRCRCVNGQLTIPSTVVTLPPLSFIIDGALVPEPVQKVFDRVRNNADFMPTWQMEVSDLSHLVKVVKSINSHYWYNTQRVLEEDLGKDWRKLVKEFDYQPLAAASIGQVHRAVLHDGAEVAMKIQVRTILHPLRWSQIDDVMMTSFSTLVWRRALIAI